MKIYIYTWDIKGSGFKQEFTAHPRGYVESFEEADIEELAFVNQLRAQVVETVLELQTRCEQSTGAEISAIIYQMLERLQVQKNVQMTVENLNRMGMPGISVRISANVGDFCADTGFFSRFFERHGDFPETICTVISAGCRYLSNR